MEIIENIEGSNDRWKSGRRGWYYNKKHFQNIFHFAKYFLLMGFFIRDIHYDILVILWSTILEIVFGRGFVCRFDI